MSAKSVPFKVGDVVVGTSLTRYIITKRGWKGVVIEVKDGKITVLGLKEDNDYTVDPAYFKKIPYSHVKKLPVVTKFDEWRVLISKNQYKFGCGALKLKREEILKYKRFLELKNDPEIKKIEETIKEQRMEDPDVKDIRKLLAVKTTR